MSTSDDTASMKLWLLRPREDLPADDNPWDPWYDKAFGFVVRASSEAEARRLAQEHGSAETSDWHTVRGSNTPAWTDVRYSTCVELTTDGEPGVIIEDVHAA